MKRLTCEMCGSTDLIKQDGVFVCQTCGCKYSIEEAKKMMVEGTVEVTGTVKVDNSAAIENYLDMARNAIDASNNKEADEYCNKIIEMDTSNWEAWFIKGKAVGWQSTLGNIRIGETINAFSKALENCPEDKKEKLGKDCKFELEHLQLALLSTRVNNFKTHPNDVDVNGLKNDVNTILTTTMNFLFKSNIVVDALGNVNYARVINNGICDAWAIVHKDYKGDEGYPTDYEFTRFIQEGDCLIEALKLALVLCGDENSDKDLNELKIQIYDNLIHINTAIKDGQSYEVNFAGGWKHYDRSKSLTNEAKAIRQRQNDEWRSQISQIRTEGEKAVQKVEQEKREAAQKAEEERRAAAKKKIDEYWACHAEEKERLEGQKSELQEQQQQLNTQLEELLNARDSVPSIEARDQKQKTMSELREQLKSLGFFKGKEKKALQARIDELGHEMERLTRSIEEEKAPIQKRIDEIVDGLKMLDNQICSLTIELTKER